MNKIKLFLIAAFVVAITALLSSCSIFKKRSVNLNQSSFSQTSESVLKSDSTAKEIDKTIIIETERADTTAKTPEVKVNTSTDFNLLDLASGLVVMDNDFVSIKQTLDTNTNKIKTETVVKPQTLNLKFDRSKTTYNDKTKEVNTNLEKKNKASTEANNKSKQTDGELKTETKGLFWFWIVGGACLALFIYLKFKK